jgi:TetR/AcrR family transcriptional regulator, transcriptional repressor for nem operon
MFVSVTVSSRRRVPAPRDSFCSEPVQRRLFASMTPVMYDDDHAREILFFFAERVFMRYPATETAEKHDRIVQEASRLFRERGFEDVTVAEVMKKTGLTHGAFYSHFESKEALMAAAVEYAMQGVLRGVKKSFPTLEGRRAYLDRYLTASHRDTPGTGCPMAALSGEIRNEPEVKGRFTANLKEIISAMGGERREAMATLATLVGAISLARAVDDEAFSREILREVQKKLDGEMAG